MADVYHDEEDDDKAFNTRRLEKDYEGDFGEKIAGTVAANFTHGSSITKKQFKDIINKLDGFEQIKRQTVNNAQLKRCNGPSCPRMTPEMFKGGLKKVMDYGEELMSKQQAGAGAAAAE